MARVARREALADEHRVVEVDELHVARRGGPDRLDQRPGRAPVVARQPLVRRPSGTGRSASRIGRTSTSSPCSCVSCPAISPPCWKPTSPTRSARSRRRRSRRGRARPGRSPRRCPSWPDRCRRCSRTSSCPHRPLEMAQQSPPGERVRPTRRREVRWRWKAGPRRASPSSAADRQAGPALVVELPLQGAHGVTAAAHRQVGVSDARSGR